MRATGIKYLYFLRASYWFVPSLMATGAVALSFLTLWVDRKFGGDRLLDSIKLDANTPEAARAALSAIAGSMITVAGVTFSMTILSVSFASAQFGPRLIGNFMRDRGNQVTLGTFIAAYVYCLMVLRTVRGAEGVSDPSQAALGAFVPQVSVLVGIGLALTSVGVLIYFIHHVPETIDVSNITAAVGRELQGNIVRMFPERIGETAERVDGQDKLPDGFFDEAQGLDAGESGYLQAVDGDGLLELATQYDVIARVQYRPGDFATAHEPVLQVWPAQRLDDEAADRFRGCFAWGSERTPTQNTTFLVDQLVEIIVRALSPGINDPFTAINCFKWLQRSLITLSERATPEPRRFDDEGNLRLVAHAVSFETFCERIFGQTLQYVAGDRNVALEVVQVIASLVLALPAGERRDVLLRHADELAAATDQGLPLESDRALMRKRCELVRRMVDDDALKQQLRDRDDWIGGSA